MKAARRYRFASAAHWAAGDLARAAAATGGGFTLAPSWSRPIEWQRGAGVAAAVGPEGIAVWNDGVGTLWFGESPAEPAPLRVPVALARATHLEATRTQLWAADTQPRVRAFARDIPVVLHEVTLAADRILDLCGDGRGGLWVLSDAGGRAFAVPIDCTGGTGPPVPLPMPCGLPRAMTWLAERLIVLDANGTQLMCVDPGRPDAWRTVSLRGMRPGADATCLASDGRRRFVVGGVDARAFGGGAFLIEGDAKGDLIGTVELPAAPRDVACGSDLLLVTTTTAVLRSDSDPGGSSRRTEVSASFVTPLLVSPQVDSGAPWLRADVEAVLPAGTALELAWAASDDADTLAAARATLADLTLDVATRRQRLRSQLTWSSPLRLTASTDASPEAACVYAMPLHDVAARSLWISLDLIAAPEATAPRVDVLEVLYPDESLMQYLPAIYRRQAAQPGDFLRLLVAALETSVDGLDARIEGLGRLLDPDLAPERWLDAIARWLGLPWDDMLPVDVKRKLLGAAPALLEGRGTRAGLQTLLDALAPGGLARITDVGVDRGFARLGTGAARGARLPALLAGWPDDALVLGAKACLGRARIGDPAHRVGPMAWLAGRVDIDIVATPEQRRAWAATLGSLLDAMTPLTAHLRTHWRAPTTRPAVPVLDDGLTLEGTPYARIGSGAMLGRTRLEPRRGITLDDAGASPGLTLQ